MKSITDFVNIVLVITLLAVVGCRQAPPLDHSDCEKRLANARAEHEAQIAGMQSQIDAKNAEITRLNKDIERIVAEQLKAWRLFYITVSAAIGIAIGAFALGAYMTIQANKKEEQNVESK